MVDTVARQRSGRDQRIRLRWFLVLVAVLGLLALSIPMLKPYVSNQNQYLLHAVGPGLPRLADDWLLTTVDPYPVFTALAGAMHQLGGKPALVLGAIVAAGVAWTALYLLASDLLRGRRPAALAATVLVAAAPLLPFIPNPLGGFAGQYILLQRGMFQPAAAGSLVLLGAALLLRARLPGAPALTRSRALVAAGAILIGCVLHPTYLVATGLLLFAAMVLDLADRRSLRLVLNYALVVVVLAVVTLALNPAIAGLGAGDPDVTSRFAFERIPHHTLISHWGPSTARYALVIVVAALLSLRAAAWFARWLLLSLALALGLALVAELTHSTALALAFPARASVILVPLSFIALAVVPLRLLGGRLPRVAVAASLGVALVLGAVGLSQTIDMSRTPSDDELVELAARVQPTGVGLVPLEHADNVRLNAGVALYVDHKSPPYVSGDLAEWFRRLDAARVAESDPKAFCGLVAGESIDWVVLPVTSTAPACVAQWRVAGTSEGFALLTSDS